MMFIRLTGKSGTLHLEADGRAICGRIGGEVVEAVGPPIATICPNCTRISRQRRERAAARGEEVAPPVVVVVAGEVERLRGEVLRLRGEVTARDGRIEDLKRANRAHVAAEQRLAGRVAELEEVVRVQRERNKGLSDANQKLRAINAAKAVAARATGGGR